MTAFKIVVPLDGSRLAEHPLAYIRSLKAMGDLHVRLITAVDISEHHPHLDEVESRDRAINIMSTYLREVTEDVREHTGVEVDSRLITGVPSYCLVNEVLDYKPDLLLLATHGRTGVLRWRFGSIADKLIRSAECNTMVVGPKATERETWIDLAIQSPFKSILVPLDGSRLAEQAVAVAQQMAQKYNSTVHLVSVASIAASGAAFGIEGFYGPEMLEATVGGLKEYLAKTAVGLGTTAVTTEVLTGEPATVLDDYTRQNAIDLVVMTTHGRGGLMRTALGSITDRVLCSAAAPVLVVRPTDND